MDAVAMLVEAIDALPDELTNEEVVALFAVADQLASWLSAAIGQIDPAADGAVTLQDWLESRARRSEPEAALFVERVTRLRS
jgi:hypothetical protein